MADDAQKWLVETDWLASHLDTPGLVVIGEGGSVDLQPCGGTHVRSTGEIGPVAVTRIEKKGKQNRRIRVSFA